MPAPRTSGQSPGSTMARQSGPVAPPPQIPVRPPPQTPLRSPPQTPVRSPPQTPVRSPPQSPPQSPSTPLQLNAQLSQTAEENDKTSPTSSPPGRRSLPEGRDNDSQASCETSSVVPSSPTNSLAGSPAPLGKFSVFLVCKLCSLFSALYSCSGLLGSFQISQQKLRMSRTPMGRSIFMFL